jgi:TRAP-type C4-dicarboxylate transport system substrate-binding protein
MFTRTIPIIILLCFIFSYSVNAITLKVNESLSLGSPEALALDEFKQIVEEQSKGEIKIRIFLNNQLGNPQESLENLMTGSLDLYSGALSYYATLLPDELNPLSLMYFFKDTEHLKRYLRGPVFKKAQEKLIKKGIRFISTEFNGDRGPYRVYLSTKPITSLSDLQGVKMRLWPNDIAIRSWKHLGAEPAVIPWTEVYLSIRQGVVSAVTAPIALVRSTKFTEVAPYVTIMKQFPQTWPMTISERVWQKLGSEHRNILVNAANEAGRVYANSSFERVSEDIDWMIENNNAVFIRINTAPFRQKMEPLYNDLINQGVLKKEIYDAINNAR